MKRRRSLSRTERYASVILELKRGSGEPLISRERAKEMTAEQIIAEFESITDDDHITPRALGGSDHVSNMQPLSRREDHPQKTKRDVKVIAKSKRLTAAQAEFRRKLLAKSGQAQEAEPPSKKRRSPMPGSRHHPSGLRKRMSGKVERW